MSNDDARYAQLLKRIDECQTDWPTDPTLQEARILQITKDVDLLPYRLATPAVRNMRPGIIRTSGLRLTCLPAYYPGRTYYLPGTSPSVDLWDISGWVTDDMLAFLAALIAGKHACACSMIAYRMTSNRMPLALIALLHWHRFGDKNSDLSTTFFSVFKNCCQSSACRRDWWCEEWKLLLGSRSWSTNSLETLTLPCCDALCGCCCSAKASITASLCTLSSELQQIPFLPRDVIGHIAEYLYGLKVLLGFC